MAIYQNLYAPSRSDPDEMFTEGTRRFTFAAFVEAFRWNAKEAVTYINEEVEDGTTVLLEQSIDGNEVWDGVFEYDHDTGEVVYVGNSEPSGEGDERARVVRGSDMISVL